MKKLILLPLIAAATLGLAACKHDAPVPDNGSGNDITLNSDDTGGNIVDETTVNSLDNASAPGNATAN